jgi:transposase
MRKLEITPMSASEIEDILKSKEDYKIALRLVSILPIAKGESSRKAQELLLLSHNQICIWVKRFTEFGLEGLKDKPKTGRKPQISNEQLAWLKNVVLTESPTKFCFNTETWTAPLIVKIIESHCNIKYSDDMVYIILKNKLGLTHKKGKGFYAEAKADVREKFVSDLKKNFMNVQPVMFFCLKMSAV